MKKIILFIVTFSMLIVIPALLFAQSKIQGRVTDINDSPIAGVTALLQKATDSTLVKGAITDYTGNYSFENIAAGNYFISFSHTAFSPQQTTLFGVAGGIKNIDRGIIKLEAASATLKDIRVTATRPFIVQEADRTVINIANSIVMSSGTALDVLEKAPGVTVDRQNDIISLMGKAGVFVYIDGKQSYLSMADVVALLKTIPADNIDNIELITNPSAKYDAAGNAGIINIRTKKNDNTGTNGTVSLTAATGHFDREYANMRLNHRTEKLNFFVNYGANRVGDMWKFDLERDWSENGERNIVNNISPIRFRDGGQNAGAGVDYYIEKNSVIGLSWAGQWSTSNERAPADASFRRTPEGSVYYQTHSAKAISNPVYNHVVNADFQHNFRKNSGQLTADFDLGYFRRAYENTLITTTTIPYDPNEPRTWMLTTMPVMIDVRSIKADYSRPLKKNWTLAAGIKSSWVRSDNDQSLFSGEENKLQLDPDLSEHFQYTEQINAAYVHFAGEMGGNTKLQWGLRTEQTRSVGNAITHSNRVARDYIDFFPSALVSRPVGKEQVLTFSYSYRIDRPGYQSLNPVRGYLDPFAYSRGNPFLQPQYTHALELKHGFRQKIFTSLNVSFTSGLISYIIQPVNLQQYERVPQNMGHAQSYSLAVSFPLNVLPVWKIQSTLTGIYGQFHFTYLNTPVTAKQLSGRLNFTNTFTFKQGWSAELSGELSAPAVDVISHSPWLGYINAGIQKSYGARWKFRLNGQDILYTQKILGYINTAGFYMHTHITPDSRVVSLSATYTFGNQKIKEVRQRKTASEEEMKRAN